MFARLRSLFRLLFVWKVSETKPDDLAKTPPDCIVVLAFGQQREQVGLGAGLYTSKLLPGPANEAIADVVANEYRKRQFLDKPTPPILAQWEFAWTKSFIRGRTEGPAIAEILGDRNNYRNTREIIQEAKELMARYGWRTAMIVAHPYHLARCTWVAEKLGIELVHDRSLTQDLETFANVWNRDVEVPENQMQTTSPSRWWWYEFRARAYFWLKGWI